MKLKDLIKRRGLGILVYGRSGSGKTSSIRNLPADKLAIVTNEAHGLAALLRWGWGEKDVEVYVPGRPSDWPSIIQMFELEGQRKEFLVLDAITTYYDAVLQEELFGRWDGKSVLKQLPGATYNLAKHRFWRMLSQALALRDLGTTVIAIAHLGYRSDKRSGEEVLYHEPAFPGKLPEEVSRQFDLILRTEVLRSEAGPKYVLTARGYYGDYTKDLYGVVGEWEDNDLWAIIQRVRQEEDRLRKSDDEAKAEFAEEKIKPYLKAHKLKGKDVKKALEELMGKSWAEATITDVEVAWMQFLHKRRKEAENGNHGEGTEGGD